MNHHREYDIAWQGLKNGIHNWQYEVTDKTLADFGYEHPDFENLETTVDVEFEKESSFFLMQFNIQGKADVTCDRCGDIFSLQLWDEYKLVIKLTDSEEKAKELNKEDAEDVVYISRSETVINIFNWIYEFIMLSFPIQKIHPNKEDGTSGCNPEVLKLLNQMSPNDAKTAQKSIWKDLEQLKNKLRK